MPDDKPKHSEKEKPKAPPKDEAKNNKKDDKEKEEPKETPAERKRRRRFWMILLCCVLGVIGIAVVALAIWHKPFYVGGNGIVTTIDRAEVRAIDEGPIEKIHVEDGDRVEKGQLLITLTNRLHEANVKLAQATLASSEAKLARKDDVVELAGAVEASAIDLAKAKLAHYEATYNHSKLVAERTKLEEAEAARRARAELEAARETFTRTQSLADRGLIGVEEAAKAKLDLELKDSLYTVKQIPHEEELAAELAALERQISLARCDVAAANAAYDAELAKALHAVELSQAALAVSEVQQDAREIRSPLDGFVTLYDLELGETVSKNSPVGEVFDDRAFIIKAKVRERYLHRVQLGQEVRIEFDGYPRHYFGYFWGKVTKLSKVVTPQRAGEGYFVVHVELEPTDQITLRPGLSAYISIEAGTVCGLRWLIGLD